MKNFKIVLHGEIFFFIEILKITLVEIYYEDILMAWTIETAQDILNYVRMVLESMSRLRGKLCVKILTLFGLEMLYDEY